MKKIVAGLLLVLACLSSAAHAADDRCAKAHLYSKVTSNIIVSLGLGWPEKTAWGLGRFIYDEAPEKAGLRWEDIEADVLNHIKAKGTQNLLVGLGVGGFVDQLGKVGRSTAKITFETLVSFHASPTLALMGDGCPNIMDSHTGEASLVNLERNKHPAGHHVYKELEKSFFVEVTSRVVAEQCFGATEAMVWDAGKTTAKNFQEGWFANRLPSYVSNGVVGPPVRTEKWEVTEARIKSFLAENKDQVDGICSVVTKAAQEAGMSTRWIGMRPHWFFVPLIRKCLQENIQYTVSASEQNPSDLAPTRSR